MKNKFRKVLLNILLVTMVLIALLVLPPGIMFSSASSASTQYVLSVSPTRMQEGLNTNITVSLQEARINTTETLKVNVTAPDGASYSANVTVVTDVTGAGSSFTEFWSGFAGANTNLVGTYNVTLFNIAGNETFATTNFIVGLTDKVKYLRSETVNIQGSGYNATANETVLVDLKFGNTSVSGLMQINASAEGIVTCSWIVPADASLGVYTLTLTNSTAEGTVKPVPDSQDFTVEAICEIQTRNLAAEPLADVAVEVYNATSGDFLNLNQTTNQTGWSKFVLQAGNYTFKAVWKNVEVGSINQSVTENVALTLEVMLSSLKLAVTNEMGTPIPLIDLNLSYNYTTRANNISETGSFTTNINGTVIVKNMFTNISYLIEARRYGFLFNTTFIESLPAQDWNNLTIIAPICTMFVQVLDSKGAPAIGLEVVAYEWSSGIGESLQSNRTDSNGNVTLALTFGRYRLRLYNDTTFVNEVTVDLVENPLYTAITIDVYNVDLSVLVVDYFGQPIPNAFVELQRKSDSDYKTTQTKTTGSNGVALFSGIIGGYSRVYVSVAGRPGESQYLYFVGPTRDVVFKMDGYVAVAGYALETSQFITIVIVLIMIVAFIVALTYKRLPRLWRRRRK